jgi:hypothetical protein
VNDCLERAIGDSWVRKRENLSKVTEVTEKEKQEFLKDYEFVIKQLSTSKRML